MKRALQFLARFSVPLFFATICVTGILLADLSLNRISTDVAERFFRNLFLVLSLIIPIVAGLGLNFGIVLGAMGGQIGLIIVQNGSIPGMAGISVAVACSIPIALLVGYLTGLLFNRARGREMITGIILGFFANGIYQFVFLILTGPLIPLHSDDVLLPEGQGVRVTINLTSVERALDDARPALEDLDEKWGPLHLRKGTLRIRTSSEVTSRFGGEPRVVTTKWAEIPILTLLVNLLLCAAIVSFFRTKLGQDLRAVGQDPHVAEIAGIRVNRCRLIAIVLSMILAGIGQIIFLQNMTVMNTFQQHEQVGFYAIAALLVGGATVTRATVGNAIVGTLLFHALIVVVTLAGQELMESPQIGEYGREFIAFAIIGTTLAIHAWRSQRRN